ncbi:MAG: hypothetical protein HWN65_12665 [Candidatus Helarchaeota archaeon]|nr:hypothetical protein [Candidatus Helarchaeota archaeon]
MASTEERHCHHCGAFHLRNVSFFAYWTQCEECGTYLCPRCSGYHDRRLTQYAFLAYMLISFIFYLGAILIIGPLLKGESGSVNFLFTYSFAGILFIIPFIALILIVRSIIRRLTKQNDITPLKCPECNGSLRVIYHDLFLYFWLFLIHILFIVTVLNETGIFFNTAFPPYESPVFSISIFYVFLLVGLFIFIIWFYKRIGRYFFPNYKTNTRVWLGEVFAVFLYMSINLVILIFLVTEDTLFSFDLFYHFASVASWFFPIFIIGSVIYKIAQKFLLNIKRSLIIQAIIASLFIIGSIYIWGSLSLVFDIYAPHEFNRITITFYSNIFSEIIPIILLSFLVGVGIGSIIKQNLFNASKFRQNSGKKLIAIIGVLSLAGLIIIDNQYYYFTGTFFFDIFSSGLAAVLLAIIIIGYLLIIIYELLSNWASSQSRWGKVLETKLGSLLYTSLMGFIIICLAFSIPLLPSLLTSYTILPNYSLITDILLLKIIFSIGLLAGVAVGLYSKNET